MFPIGVKSLASIASIDDPVDRVPMLARLLEYLLKQLTPDYEILGLTFDQLLDKHQDKFGTITGVDNARWARNQIVHATGKASVMRIMQAERTFREAINAVLPNFPDSVC